MRRFANGCMQLRIKRLAAWHGLMSGCASADYCAIAAIRGAQRQLQVARARVGTAAATSRRAIVAPACRRLKSRGDESDAEFMNREDQTRLAGCSRLSVPSSNACPARASEISPSAKMHLDCQVRGGSLVPYRPRRGDEQQ